jgi:hypothetical protein
MEIERDGSCLIFYKKKDHKYKQLYIPVIVWLFIQCYLCRVSHRWAREKGEGKREIGLWLVQCHPSQMIFFIDSISLSVFCLEPQVALARIASAEDCLWCLVCTVLCHACTPPWFLKYDEPSRVLRLSHLFCFVLLYETWTRNLSSTTRVLFPSRIPSPRFIILPLNFYSWCCLAQL